MAVSQSVSLLSQGLCTCPALGPGWPPSLSGKEGGRTVGAIITYLGTSFEWNLSHKDFFGHLI